jgi:hypothetical protein
MTKKWWILFCLAAAVSWAQTRVNLATQSNAVDFASQEHTRPWQSGTELPSSCDAGMSFFKTDAAPGLNLYICVAPDVWLPVAGSSNAVQIQSNNVSLEKPAETGQLYAGDAVNNLFNLMTPGRLLSVVGSTLDVASDTVAQYAWGTTVPATCSQVGVFFFDTDAPSGGKLYYCNGATYEPVQSGGGLPDPGANGIISRTASGATTVRTLQGATGKISITNGDGVSANPLIGLGSDVVDKTQPSTYTAGVRQTFSLNAISAESM